MGGIPSWGGCGGIGSRDGIGAVELDEWDERAGGQFGIDGGHVLLFVAGQFIFYGACPIGQGEATAHLFPGKVFAGIGTVPCV